MGDYHIAFQSIVPVRKTAAEASEMVTQLLFGDVMEVLAEDRNWRHIRNLADGYEGWADRKLLFPVEAAWVKAVKGWEYVFAPALPLTYSLHGLQGHLPLTMGCRIPILEGQEEAATLDLRMGAWQMEVPRTSLRRPRPGTPEELLEVSARYLGAPYLWGGKTLWGIDCSGFVQMVHAQCGIQLPRDAHQQMAAGGPEVPFAARQPGDLAFFENDKGKVIHVGIVLEGGKIRHASGFVHDDWLREGGIFGLATQLQTHKLCSIRRFH